MKKLLFGIISITQILVSYKSSDAQVVEKWKQEIREAEQNFAKMVSEDGIHKAFMAYAADDAVIMRNDELFIGKANIDLFYKNKNSKGLVWTPDFVGVSASGDLGYTYGHYTFTNTDLNGTVNVSKGVFHTVWVRQSDGSWKFVWD